FPVPAAGPPWRCPEKGAPFSPLRLSPSLPAGVRTRGQNAPARHRKNPPPDLPHSLPPAHPGGEATPPPSPPRGGGAPPPPSLPIPIAPASGRPPPSALRGRGFPPPWEGGGREWG